MTDVVLAVDGGQTGTRALLVRTDGTVVAERQGGPIRHLFGDGGAETRDVLRELTAGIASPAAAALGLTSVRPDSPEAAKVGRMLHELTGVDRIAVVPDYVTALLGASLGEPGIVVVAGGGAVAYGRTADGREATAGGAGYLLGDEGSAYDIGRQAIAAALRAEDGRGPRTTLAARVRSAFGIEDLARIKEIVYAPGFRRDRIAALAPLVMEEARAGDAPAIVIVTRAARELAVAAIAVANKLFPELPASVYPVGGVFRAGAIILESFHGALAERPDLAIGVPARPPVVGALILALRLVGVTELFGQQQLPVTASCTNPFM